METTLPRTLHRKLLEIKRLVPSIKKNQKGFNYDYANPEAVLGTINPLLNERGIIVKSEVTEVISSERVQVETQKGSKPATLVFIKMRFTLIDTDSDEREVYEFAASGCNGEDKSFGSALTYGQRYFYLMLVNAPQNREDPDHSQAKKTTTSDDFEL
jgi:hypothetical protein